jgi:nucleoid DNA-binding protein
MTLTKDHLVSAVAEANGYPRNKAVELVETIIELIKSNLIASKDVQVR